MRLMCARGLQNVRCFVKGLSEREEQGMQKLDETRGEEERNFRSDSINRPCVLLN